MKLRPTVSVWLVAGLLLLPATAAAADQLGIFWDATYTQNAIEVPAGSVTTGYLVLKDPSTTGVLGWECRVGQEGPGQFLEWALEGQTINVGSGNDFQVGIGGDPLPATPDGVLLATFQYYYPEIAPVFLSLVPLYHASVPGEMSFIPADDPGTLRVMTTVTGDPVVATINGNIPVPVVEPSSLNFGTVPVGTSHSAVFTVSNQGGGVLVVDPQLQAGCEAFSLPDATGPVSLYAGQSVTTMVTFLPQTLGPYLCEVALGDGITPLQVGGSAREPIVSWTINPTAVDFGGVPLGDHVLRTVTVRNTGEAPIDWAPSLPDPVAGLSISSVSGTDPIPVGNTGRVTLSFQPETVMILDTILVLGGVLPEVPVTGYSREPQYNWNLVPGYVSFVDVEAGQTYTQFVFLQNTGELTLDLDLAIEDPGLGWSVVPEGPASVPPGSYLQFVVQFVSPFPGIFDTRLLLGGPIPPMNLRGTVALGAEPCLLTPARLDFGQVTVGEAYYLDLHVTNQQTNPLDVYPVAPQGWLDVLGAPATLQLGETASYSVKLQAATAGTIDTVIQLGTEVCADVPVTAVAVEPSCLVTPGPVDFGVVAAGQVHVRDLELQNPFTSPLDVAPVSDSEVITVVGDPATIPPGGTLTYQLRFAPPDVGSYAATVDLGAAACDPVPVTGEADVGSCQVSTPELVFGEVLVGAVVQRYVDVFNDGQATLALTPTVEGPYFGVSGGVPSLASGDGTTFTVSYHPLYQGAVQGTLDFGTGSCPPVVLTGTGYTQIQPPGSDAIGIYFDPGTYQEIEWYMQDDQPEVVTGYLVLREPSDPAGVYGWECRFSVEGQVFAMDWQLQGTAINVGEPGEFIVGLASPLPWAQDVLLATGTFLAQVDPAGAALLKLGPISTPSLPGQMAFLGGSDPNLLLPMTTATGSDVVAVISGSSPLPVEMPAPSARLAAGEVSLQWTLSGDPGEGCHVYRRGPVGETERLTDRPVTATEGGFTYVDRPFGYADGTVLHYSYAKVAGGVEGPRSPETEVHLTGMPAPGTKLLANVPNPFNPSTEVRFQLQRPGRTRIAVYDMTGRLVRDLVDEDLAAGPHHRVWDGRDRGGRPVPSGAYYLRLETPDATDHRKVMLLK